MKEQANEGFCLTHAGRVHLVKGYECFTMCLFLIHRKTKMFYVPFNEKTFKHDVFMANSRLDAPAV